MKSISKQNRNFIIGLMLSLPTAYFIFINILNELGYSYLFEAIWPTLQGWGVQESLGWNINLLILFGPVLALILNVLSVIRMRFEFSEQTIDCQVSVKKSWWNLAIVFISGGALFILTTYLFFRKL